VNGHYGAHRQNRAVNVDERKYIKCSCEHCGGHIEFPADVAGAEVQCPHCKWQTKLTAPGAPATALPLGTIPKKQSRIGWITTGISALLVAAVGAGVLYWRGNKARSVSPTQGSLLVSTSHQSNTKTAEPLRKPMLATNDFAINEVSMERAKSGSVVYAVGNIRNELERQRFGVKIDLDLFDGEGVKVGTAKDYLSILEPKREWRFKALVLDKKAVEARLASITEDR
jgi:hypothetical protein